MKATIGDLVLVITSGNIAGQREIDAVVNAANAQLRPGGGVAGAIHRAAGPGLDRECRRFAPIQTGEAVITGGHGLPNKYVIHCLGPVYGRDEPSDQLLADCYFNALRLAEENCVESVAFPSISTGVFGFPVKEAARIALKVVMEQAPKLKNVKLVKFVLFGEEALRIHEEALKEIAGGGAGDSIG